MIKTSDFIRHRRALQKQLSEPACMTGYGKPKKATESYGWLKKAPNHHPLITNHVLSAFFRLSFAFRSLLPALRSFSAAGPALFLTIASCFLPAASPLYSAEFEIVDKFSVNNYSEFRGSVTIQGKDANPAILDARTQSGAAALFISTNSSVGIGTTNPAGKLDIRTSDANTNWGTTAGQVPLNLRNDDPTSNNWVGMVFRSNGGVHAADISAQLTDQTNGYSKLFFATRNSSGIGQRMTIDGSGNVGIATTSPQHPLHIKGTAEILAVEASSGAGEIKISGVTDQDAGIVFYEATTPRWYFMQRGSTGTNEFSVFDQSSVRILTVENAGTANTLYLKSNGNVGIGTTNPQNKLTVVGDINATSGTINDGGSLLAGLTPTFSGWTTNPGTAADIANELTDTLTTNGVIATAPAVNTITYNLGSSARIIVTLSGEISGANVFNKLAIRFSDDGSTWYDAAYHIGPPVGIFALTAAGKAQYIQLYATHNQAPTVSKLRIRAYHL